MIRSLLQLVTGGNATQPRLFPALPSYSRGLPLLTGRDCVDGCSACAQVCPTEAIAISAGSVTLDRGRCIACAACTDTCPADVVVPDHRTALAVERREDLVLSSADAGSIPSVRAERLPEPRIWTRSLHVRHVSTGDNATDMEMAAAYNPIFDASRFGIHSVASPRFADALLVSGPVARAMREPLLRCWDAMAEPRIVIAAGAAAISGVPFSGYAETDGVDAVLPVAVYVPGNPPHPWYILHGLLIAMGHPLAAEARNRGSLFDRGYSSGNAPFGGG
jgi:Ni,Fe-hydrogenase III small subunit/ferredoxin